jgi:hypothetical protein
MHNCISAERERESKSYVDGGNAVSSKKELVSQLVIHPLYVLCGVEKSTLSESTLVLPRLFPNVDQDTRKNLSGGQVKSLHKSARLN